MRMYLMERVNSGLTSHQQQGHTKTGSRFNKTKSAIFVALMWSLFSEDVHSELILKSHPKDRRSGVLIDLAISGLSCDPLIGSFACYPLHYRRSCI